MNVLELHDLTREFTRRGKPFAAVDHVNLILREGEFIAIVGRSGNGKSTLLNLITGLLRPTDGTITLDGRNIVALRGDTQPGDRIRDAESDVAAESHRNR